MCPLRPDPDASSSREFPRRLSLFQTRASPFQTATDRPGGRDVIHEDLRGALAQDEKLVARFALSDDVVARGNLPGDGLLRHVEEFSRGNRREVAVVEQRGQDRALGVGREGRRFVGEVVRAVVARRRRGDDAASFPRDARLGLRRYPPNPRRPYGDALVRSRAPAELGGAPDRFRTAGFVDRSLGRTSAVKMLIVCSVGPPAPSSRRASSPSRNPNWPRSPLGRFVRRARAP